MNVPPLSPMHGGLSTMHSSAMSPTARLHVPDVRRSTRAPHAGSSRRAPSARSAPRRWHTTIRSRSNTRARLAVTRRRSSDELASRFAMPETGRRVSRRTRRLLAFTPARSSSGQRTTRSDRSCYSDSGASVFDPSSEAAKNFSKHVISCSPRVTPRPLPRRAYFCSH